MQLLQIQEPNKKLESKEKEIAVGIDFGTTNSLIAIANNQQVEIIPFHNKRLLKSLISFDDEGQLKIGEESKYNIYSIKRLIGKNKADYSTLSENIKPFITQNDEKIFSLDINNKQYNILELASLVFKQLKQQAEAYLNSPVKKAVVTVPAYFDDTAKNQVKFAAQMAGIDVLRLIAEPTAAAFAYGLDNKSEGMYLVYDLGGGTFDLSLLNMQMGVFQVLATSGDNNLGGDDLDEAILELIKQKLPSGLPLIEPNKLLDYAKFLKENLDRENLTINLEDNTEISFAHKDIINKITPILAQTFKILDELIAEQELDLDLIEGIILVGGSTKLSYISQQLKAKYGLKIFANFDPELVVARGAALQAENLTKGSDNLLIDVAPLSIGMELMGGIVEKVINRNSPLPCTIKRNYTTYIDNQTAMKFHLVQGEREFAEDCRSLAHFELKNIPAMKAGAAKIEVEFKLDADGLLTVAAEEVSTNSKQEISVKPSFGLQEDEMILMLKNAFLNAEEDFQKRQITERHVEIKSILSITKDKLNYKNFLSKEEKQFIENELLTLEQSLQINDIDLLDENIKNFQAKTAKFFERIMNYEINTALTGKNLD